MMNGMSLEYPYALLIILVFIFCHFICPLRSRAIYFAHTDRIRSEGAVSATLLQFLKWLAIVSLLLALAAPYRAKHIDITPKQGYDIALLLDASLSMRERGFSENNLMLDRFDSVKAIVSDFIRSRKNDNLGLVVFGSFAFIAAPLTYDKRILSDIVSRLQIGMAGRATAIFDALGQGVKLLKNSHAKSKIAILITDGENTTQNVSLDAVLKLAQKYQVKIYTIGIGREGEFNAGLLNKIAQESGAKMFKAHSKEQLSKIYKEIDRLEKSEIKSKHFEKRSYYYHLPLTVALISLLLFLVLRQQRGIA